MRPPLCLVRWFSAKLTDKPVPLEDVFLREDIWRLLNQQPPAIDGCV